MEYLDSYLEAVSKMPTIILENEKKNIERAAQVIAEATINGNLIHIFGTGAHSSMAGEEFFLRPGSLMNINPIFDPGLSVNHGAYKSFMLERLTGYSKHLLEYYRVKKNDVVIVVNAYGINSVTIDAAIEAKSRGAIVIGVTSKEFASSVPIDHPSRHPCKKSLYELKEVDIVIDSHVPIGDSVIELPGTAQKFGPISTICNCIVLGMINAAAVKCLVDKGIKPDMIMSPYFTDGGAQNNELMIDKYYEKIKHL